MHLKPNKELSDQIYAETLSRIKEDDDSVPMYDDPYFYYSRTVKGLQYPIKCRTHLSMESPEEVILDLNLMPDEYIDLGTCAVSPDHSILAYSLDLSGAETYSIYFKNLATGRILGQPITETGGDIVWYNDSRTIIYNTLDETHRSFKLWKQEVGNLYGELVYHETNEQFIVSPGKTLSKKFILIDTCSSLTSEVLYIDASATKDAPKLFLARKFEHKYKVEHQEDCFIILSDGYNQKYLNSRLCFCPLVCVSDIV